MQSYFSFLGLCVALAFVRCSEQGGCCSTTRERGCVECPPPRLPSSPPPLVVQSGRFITMRQDIQEAADRTAPDASGNELAFNIHRYLKTRSYGPDYKINLLTWNPAVSSTLLVSSTIVNQRNLGTSAGFWTNPCNQRPFPPDDPCENGGALVQRVSDRMYAMVTWANAVHRPPSQATLIRLNTAYLLCTEYLGGSRLIDGPVSLAAVALCIRKVARLHGSADTRGILVVLEEGPDSVNQGRALGEGTLIVKRQEEVGIFISSVVGVYRGLALLGRIRLGVYILPPRF